MGLLRRGRGTDPAWQPVLSVPWSASERWITARKIGGRSLAVAVRLSPFDKLRTPGSEDRRVPSEAEGLTALSKVEWAVLI
jgi:hypothetical protein